VELEIEVERVESALNRINKFNNMEESRKKEAPILETQEQRLEGTGAKAATEVRLDPR
jgi:hypothetical protein